MRMLVLLLVGTTQFITAHAKGANILYVVGDDYGYADIGYHALEGPGDQGSTPSTPRMDAFAQGGVRLESFYAQPICAASRSSMMTGRYVHRFGFQHNNPPKAAGGVGGVPLSEKMLPEFLKDAGYETHLVGKWHCGMSKEGYLPHNRGFDTAFGYYEGAIDYYKHSVGPFLDLHFAKAQGEQQCVPQANGTYDLDLWTHRLGQILADHDAKDGPPLFVYMSLHSVHAPNEVPQKWFDMYPNVTEDGDSRRTMLGMVSAMDAGIGDLVDMWEAHGDAFWSNSVVLFHSDNGGATYEGGGALNYPLRGGKVTLFEGGMRVSAWAYGPLIENPGRVQSGLMHITDMLPTFVGLAHGKLAGGKPLDGVDLWASIGRGEESPRTEIVHQIDPFGNRDEFSLSGCETTGDKGACQDSSALRQGDWKLIVGMFAVCDELVNASQAIRFCGHFRYEGAGTLGRKTPVSRTVSGTPVALFNIANDPEELHDVAVEQQEIVQRMLARLDKERASEWHEPQWKGTNACDTPDGSCNPRHAAYVAAALRKGCIDSYLEEAAATV